MSLGSSPAKVSRRPALTDIHDEQVGELSFAAGEGKLLQNKFWHYYKHLPVPRHALRERRSKQICTNKKLSQVLCPRVVGFYLSLTENNNKEH